MPYQGPGVLVVALFHLSVVCVQAPERRYGRGPGWFSLFVALTALPIAIAIDTISIETTVSNLWRGVPWAAWAVLWMFIFPLLARHKPIVRPIAWMAIFQGIFTDWILGYRLLIGRRA